MAFPWLWRAATADGKKRPVPNAAIASAQAGRPGEPQSYVLGQADLSRWEAVFQPSGSMFSPGYPLAPVEPEQVRVRDFPVGYNYVYTPRAYEPVDFPTLRALADNHDLTRLAIDTRKDQIEALDWQIKSIDEDNPASDAPDRIAKVAEFWRHPQGPLGPPFASWLRKSLEDLLVIDAPCFEIRRDRGGEVIGLDIIDGSTIKVLIDDTGRQPLPPAPAYEQVIHGRPWRLLTADELLYLPRNIRPQSPYGFSPVQAILVTINMALRRQTMQLQHFCYSDDTEVLTRAGWKRFSDVLPDDDFAAREINTGDFRWERAYDGYRAPYCGKMIRFSGKSLDLLVTPDHRMLIHGLPRGLGDGRNFRASEHVITAEQLAAFGTRNTAIPLSSKWTGTEIESRVFVDADLRSIPVTMSGDDYCAFMGMYLADGCVRRHAITIAAPPKAPKKYGPFGDLLRKLFGSSVCETKKGQFEVCRKALADHLRPYGRAYEKFIPDDIREATPRQIEIFLRYYLFGDGCATGTPQAYTVSRKLADHLTEVAQKAGYSPSVWTRPPGTANVGTRVVSRREAYFLTFSRIKATKGWHAEVVDYDGIISCVSVPSRFLYVRRNGKAAWCGNTVGNVPAGMVNAPESWNVEQIRQFQEWFDSLLSGNTAERTKLVWTPSGAKYQAFKEAPYKDGFDEWLVRIVCYAFSLPPTPFVTVGIQRTTADTLQEAALKEGLAPLSAWVKRMANIVIQRHMGHPDLEFAWAEDEALDPQSQAAILDKQVRAGLKAINEGRGDLGLDPVEGGDEPMVYLPTGPVLVRDIAAGLTLPQPSGAADETGAPDEEPPETNEGPPNRSKGNKPKPKPNAGPPEPKPEPRKQRSPKKQAAAQTGEDRSGGDIDPDNAVPVSLPIADADERGEVEHLAWHAAEHGDADDAPIRVVPIADVVATQAEVDAAIVARHARHYAEHGGYKHPPLLLAHGGKYYVLDGHHHIEGAIEAGAKDIAARVITADGKTARATMTQADADYVGHPVGGARCGMCTMFRAPDLCTLVKGEISPDGHCRFFEGAAKKSAARTLYVNRPLKNAADLIQWARGQGFSKTLVPDDMHVTVAFSRDPVDWDAAGDHFDEIRAQSGQRSVKSLGDKGAVVLLFESPELSKRWQQFRDAGASWDYPGYRPHVTISYEGAPADLLAVEPYDGPLVFGPERFSEVEEDWEAREASPSAAAKQAGRPNGRRSLIAAPA